MEGINEKFNKLKEKEEQIKTLLEKLNKIENENKNDNLKENNVNETNI